MNAHLQTGKSLTNLCRVFGNLHKKWTIEQMQELASGNGGKCLSEKYVNRGSKLEWVCKEGHQWKASARLVKSGAWCKTCNPRIRKSRVLKSGTSLAIKFPHLLSEWDYEKNDIDPNEMSPYSNHKVFWKCIYGHSWNASIDSRTLKESGCRHCRSRTSRFEIFILCELRSIFKEVVWRRKFEGVEADIYLVSENIAIEVDGEHWHKDKIELDRAKSELFEKLGIKLIRVRSSALPSIKGLQILYPRNQDDFEIVIELFELLSEEIDNSNLQQYLLEKVRKGEQEYKEIISRLPAPPEEESLAFLYPELVKEWDYEKNFPLTPDLFAAKTHHRVWWICAKNHSWDAVVKNRTLSNSGCPDCRVDKLVEIRKLAIDEINQYAKSKGGSCDTTNYVNSKKGSIQWKCSEGHTWSARTDYVIRLNKWCPKCDRIKRFAPIRKNSIEKINAYVKKKGGSCDTTTFINMNSKIPWKCAEGHTWVASASMLKNNTWCKDCK